MDRTEEFVSLLLACGYEHWSKKEEDPNIISGGHEARGNSNRSVFDNLSANIATSIKQNQSLLKRIEKLTQRKEFSNDPTSEINQISEMFQLKLVTIKREMEKLKANKVQSAGSHQQQHWNLILSFLQKNTSDQIESFQNLMKAHGENVQQRESRVFKYGHSSLPSPVVLPGASDGSNSSTNKASYAMFNPTKRKNQESVSGNMNSELRRRHGPGSGSGSSGHDSDSSTRHYSAQSPYQQADSHNNNNSLSSNSNDSHSQEKTKQQKMRYSRSRQEAALQVESSVREMGKLFSKMSELVMAQSEVITRIEDDVEFGLQQTEEAHESMKYFQEITKGNRSLIFKIFGLLIFFIFLFLYFT